MNGEPKCHNSESIIIKIAAIVVHSHVCEYISVTRFVSPPASAKTRWKQTMRAPCGERMQRGWPGY